ncbi:lactose-binding lectin l-2-like [Phyllopteryx taeniolatus]|uniref:lactose-binding lectin l-2-like n=1 Tax=Phyllopteryx taeniolatus TaxID=161469 RepID=UPI002AD3582A|nr:lactose-binding lectin l-2-like [Phyllopteryx taeniolatus]
MAFALHSLFLLCGISGLLTGVWSFPMKFYKDNNCPKDWTQLDSLCYIYEEELRSFADAEAICNILGGNLVSIHSGLENAVVLEVAKNGTAGFWIGLSDSLEADDYIWTDGTREDFTNFDVTNPSLPQPNSANGDCVQLDKNDGFWQTMGCADLAPYVCVMEAGH